jgi:hypothetical protein
MQLHTICVALRLHFAIHLECYKRKGKERKRKEKKGKLFKKKTEQKRKPASGFRSLFLSKRFLIESF